MKYSVWVTNKEGGNYRVTVAGLPDCRVEGSSQPAAKTPSDTFPLEEYGRFENCPEWGMVFDEIEKQKEQDATLFPKN